MTHQTEHQTEHELTHVCLAASSLAISEAGGHASVEHSLHQWLSCVLVHYLVRDILVKRTIKSGPRESNLNTTTNNETSDKGHSE